MEDGSDGGLTEVDSDEKDILRFVTQEQGSELNKNRSGRHKADPSESGKPSIDLSQDENRGDSMFFYGTMLIIVSFLLFIIGPNADSLSLCLASPVIFLLGCLLFALGNKADSSVLVLTLLGLMYIASAYITLAFEMSGGWGGMGIGGLSEWGGP